MFAFEISVFVLWESRSYFLKFSTLLVGLNLSKKSFFPMFLTNSWTEEVKLYYNPRYSQNCWHVINTFWIIYSETSLIFKIENLKIKLSRQMVDQTKQHPVRPIVTSLVGVNKNFSPKNENFSRIELIKIRINLIL